MKHNARSGIVTHSTNTADSVLSVTTNSLTTDTQIAINSGATIDITSDDFTNGTVVASGNANATISLIDIFWGTINPTLIAAGTPSFASGDTLTMDNLNTHTKGAFHETFEPEKARSLVRRIEFCPTPKHGSWLHIGESLPGRMPSAWPAGSSATTPGPTSPGLHSDLGRKDAESIAYRRDLARDGHATPNIGAELIITIAPLSIHAGLTEPASETRGARYETRARPIPPLPSPLVHGNRAPG